MYVCFSIPIKYSVNVVNRTNSGPYPHCMYTAGPGQAARALNVSFEGEWGTSSSEYTLFGCVPSILNIPSVYMYFS